MNTTSGTFKLPILVYHRIISDQMHIKDILPGSRPYCLEKGKFQEQLKYLQDNRYQCVSVSEVYGIKERDSVAITFDDGFESDYFVAFPELKKRDYHATFYIVTGYVGSSGYMDWNQIKELKSGGMEIGSHSMAHRCLLALNRNEILQELSQSKKEIEEKIGEAIESFSIPFGFVNQDIIETAFEVGYKTVCTSKIGLIDPESSPKIYGRFGIRKKDGIKDFQGIVEKKFFPLMKISFTEQLKSCLKNIMGRKLWLAFRKEVLGWRN